MFDQVEQLFKSGTDLTSGDDLRGTKDEVFADGRSRSDHAVCDRFIRVLRGAQQISSGRLLVLVAVRSDYLESLENHKEMKLLAERRVVRQLGPIGGNEIREVIAQPFRRADILLEPQLIDAIANETAENTLPLMALTLQQMHDITVDENVRKFTLDMYRARVGGIKKAIGRVIATIKSELGLQTNLNGSVASSWGALEKPLRSALLQLVSVDKENRIRSKPAPMDNMPKEAEKALEMLLEARLLSNPPGRRGRWVEVVHETVFNAWPEFNEWIQRYKEFLQWRERCEARIKEKEWLRHGTLDQGKEYLNEEPGLLTVSERNHVIASLRAFRSFVSLLVAGSVALALLSAVTGLALRSESNARTRADSALTNESEARTRADIALTNETEARFRGEIERVAAQSRAASTEDPVRGLLLADKAYELRGDRQGLSSVDESLHNAYRFIGGVALPLGGGRVLSGALSRDGSRLVTTGNDGEASFWRLDRLEPPPDPILITRDANRPSVLASTWIGDTSRAVTASETGRAEIWDLSKISDTKKTLQPVQSLEHSSPIYAVVSGISGKWVVTGGEDGLVKIWDVQRPERKDPIQIIPASERAIFTLAISDDESRLVTAGEERVARIWQISSDGSTSRRTGEITLQDPVFKLALSRDGQCLVTVGQGRTVWIWDLAGLKPGEQPKGIPLHGHTASVWTVALSRDGRRLITAGYDRTIRVWDLVHPEIPPIILRGHDGLILVTLLSEHGRRLVTGSEDGILRVWNLDRPETEPMVLRGGSGPVYALSSIGGDGANMIAAGGKDAMVRVWNLNSPGGPEKDRSLRDLGVLGLGLSASSRRLVSLSEWVEASPATQVDARSSVQIWDLSSPESPPIQVAHGHGGRTGPADVNRDGKRLGPARNRAQQGRKLDDHRGRGWHLQSVGPAPKNPHTVSRVRRRLTNPRSGNRC